MATALYLEPPQNGDWGIVNLVSIQDSGAQVDLEKLWGSKEEEDKPILMRDGGWKLGVSALDDRIAIFDRGDICG